MTDDSKDARAAGPSSGSAFFDSFFASALQRANMSSGELKGLTDELSAAAHPVRGQAGSSQTNDVYAPDGNGLDCGRDPGDVSEPTGEEPSASKTINNNHNTTAIGASQRRILAQPGPSKPSSSFELVNLLRAGQQLVHLPSASASASMMMQHHHSNARAAATALLSRSSSSHLAASTTHGAPTTKITPDLDALATTRGGGLGTPTGERTYIGSAWAPLAPLRPLWIPTASVGPPKRRSIDSTTPPPKPKLTKLASPPPSQPSSSASVRIPRVPAFNVHLNATQRRCCG